MYKSSVVIDNRIGILTSVLHFSIDWPRAGISPRRCIRVYKCCFLLNNLSNITFGRLLVPGLKFVFTALIIGSLFSLLRFFGELDLYTLGFIVPLYVGSAGILVPAAVLTSALYRYSSQFQRNVLAASRGWKTKKMQLVLAKDIRACQLIRCEVGGLYHMEAKAKLTLAHSIVNGLVFLLVQHKN